MSLRPRFIHSFNRPASAPRWVLTLGVVLTVYGGLYGAVVGFGRRAQATGGGAAPAAGRVGLEAAGAGTLRVNLRGGAAVRAAYSGDATARGLLEQNLASPRALAAADFDEDGMPDLVAGYGAEGGGVLSLHRGNFAAVYPHHQAALDRARLEGESSRSPFHAPARAWPLAVAADFVAAGDFDADGHFDVVVAEQGGGALYLLAGDGKGNLGEAQSLALPGRLTALAAGEINRADALADLALGVEAEGGAKLLVYESPAGAWRAEPEVFGLSQRAAALAVGSIDRDAFGDVAVGVGREVAVVRGRDRRLTAEGTQRAVIGGAAVERVTLPGAVRALAVGSFSSGGRQVAALIESGAVYLASEPGARTAGGPFGSPANERRGGRPGAAAWQSELFTENVGAEMTALLGAKVSTAANDDLLAVGAGSRRLEVVARTKPSGNAAESGRAAFEFDGALVGALPMHLNRDAISDLVILRQGAAQPAVVESLPEATFTVTNTQESGPGTLRDAIISANRNPGADVILFSISGSAQQTINVSFPLPAIDEAVTIDATSQPGFAGTPVIQLTGPTPGSSPVARALTVNSGGGGTTIRGLAINRFGGDAIAIFSSGNVVEGNYIGTNLAGTAGVPNAGSGVLIDGRGFTANNNRVGGTTAAARNVIAANQGDGVTIFGTQLILLSEAVEAATGNVVQGNYIGVDATGNTALGNFGAGVAVIDAASNTVGGAAAGAGNVIAGNGESGVVFFRGSASESTAGSLVQGNRVGLNAAGTAALGNADGVFIEGDGVTVGGTSAAARNVISGNDGAGVSVGTLVPSIGTTFGAAERAGLEARAETDLARDTLVQGNYIGTDAAGTGSVANGAQGVVIGSTAAPRPNTVNNTVGGAAAGAGNVIAFNAADGVALLSGSGNAVLSNSIFSNGGLGILRAAGANNDQAAPVLTSAVTTPGGVTVTGTLASTPNTAFTLQFFSNQTCDPSGSGEGQTFIGSTTGTTDANGALSFTANLAAVTSGQIITATATSSANNTSPFSNCQTAEDRADLALAAAVAPANPAALSTVTATFTLTNNGPSNASNVVVTASLPSNLTNVTCAATNGGVCAGTGTTRTITYATLSATAPNNTSVITLTGTVPCLAQSFALAATAAVTARSTDPVTANNSATATTTAQAGTAAARVTPDAGGAISLGPVVAGNVTNPPSATFTVTSTGCLPVTLGLATFTRDIQPPPAPGMFASLDDSRFFRLSVVNASGPDTPLAPNTSGQFNVNRTLTSGQTLRLRVTFVPPFPEFAGRFAGRTGTLTAAQFLPDVVNSRLTIPFNGGDPTNPLTVAVTGRVSPAVQIVTREGFNIPQGAPPAAEGVGAVNLEATPLVLFRINGDEFRVAFSLYDPNLNVTKVTYQFYNIHRQPVSDPIEVPVGDALAQSGLIRGQSFTLVQSFLGATARPDVAGVRLTVTDGDGATASASSDAVAPLAASPGATESASAGAVINLPAVRLDRVTGRDKGGSVGRREAGGERRMRKE